MVKQVGLFKFSIPRRQLEELGFDEINENLFMKKLENDIRLYRDYRKGLPVSYAYHLSNRVDYQDLKDYLVVVKIERFMNGLLQGY